MRAYPLKCRISAAAGVTRVDVYDDIGEGGFFSEGLTAKSFAAQLGGVKGPLEVHINSGGGDVFDGIAISTAIRGHKGPVTTVVDGLAASIASVIAQAGAERVVEPGSMVMIHDAFGMCTGDAAEMEKMAATLDAVSDNIAGIYAGRSGRPKDEWRAAMREETWFTAEEAVAAGLADRVGGGRAELPEGLDLAAYAVIPGRIAAALRTLPVAAARYDPDGDGDDDSTPEGDTDHDHWAPDGTQLKPVPGKPMPGNRALAEVWAYLDGLHVANADVDESAWDGGAAMSAAAASDDPASAYRAICAGRREGDPGKQSSWALPHHKHPGAAPNAAGVRNALSRLPQTQGLTNEAAARAHLEAHMRAVSPDSQHDHAGPDLSGWDPDVFRAAFEEASK